VAQGSGCREREVNHYETLRVAGPDATGGVVTVGGGGRFVEPPAVGGDAPGADSWRAILDHKWRILGLGLLFALIAAGVVSQMESAYRASGTVLIEGPRVGTIGAAELVSGVTPEAVYLTTQAEIMRSRDVAGRVIRALDLTRHPDFDPRQRKPKFWETWLATHLPAVATMLQGRAGPPADDQVIEAMLVEGFVRNLSVQPVRQSQLIRITFDAKDPALAARIVNSVAEIYARADVESRSGVSDRAGARMNDRIVELRQRLDASERALQTYREREGLIDTKTLGIGGVGPQLDSTMQRLVEARVRRAEAETAQNQFSRAQSDPVEAASIAARYPAVQRARDLQVDAERRLAEVSAEFGPAHPRFRAAEIEVAAARASTARQLATAGTTVTQELNAARANERSIEAAVARLRGAVQDVNRKDAQLGVLEREVATNRQVLQEFMTRSRETSVALDPGQPRMRVVDPAVAPLLPIRPARRAMVVVGSIAGLLFGALFAVVLRKLDTTIRSESDVERKLGQHYLGALPVLPPDRDLHLARVTLDHPRDLYAESVRAIAAGLQMSALQSSREIVAVTSSVPDEGKSSFAMNLAFSRSRVSRVLLIEGDLRRPSFAKHWQLDVGSQAGLSELIAGTASFEECVLQVEGTGLHVILSGAMPADPTMLLDSPRFADTLATLRERYDLIIIDCPPVLRVSDALMIGRVATGVVYLVRAGRTPIARVRSGIRRLAAAGIPFYGVVLNHFRFADEMAGYYGAYAAPAAAPGAVPAAAAAESRPGAQGGPVGTAQPEPLAR